MVEMVTGRCDLPPSACWAISGGKGSQLIVGEVQAGQVAKLADLGREEGHLILPKLQVLQIY